MFWMGRDMGFRMAGMPMDNGMMAGMGLIVGGIGLSAWGLLPRNLAQHMAASGELVVSAPEAAPLSWAHWRLMAGLVVALIIDDLKTGVGRASGREKSGQVWLS